MFVGEADPTGDPILSQIYAPDKLLLMFPAMRIFACEIDCLRDSSFEMANKLLEAGHKDTKIYMLKNFTHGT
jgi:hypothetical protein